MLKSFILLISLSVFGVFSSKNEDEIIFDKLSELKKTNNSKIKITQIAKKFLGHPYEAHTLESKTKEELTINLRTFDCQTLVESSMAIQSSLNSSSPNFSNFEAELQKLRYRNGIIRGYASRVHYFTEWLALQEKRGKIKIMNFDEASEIYTKELNFMSKNAGKYVQLADLDQFTQIRAIESEISKNSIKFVPTQKLKNVVGKIKEGDLIVFTTSIEGLDVVHEGFATILNNQIHLLHASQDQKKVIISQENLEIYLQNHKKMNGLIVAKIL